ncbi:MAG TPA: hypothetical protein VJP85_15400 [Candidatus Baltobacteraceae bacterium]|nr:hypothetical protein [Candidatus Baltobacteraceae bacterium]
MLPPATRSRFRISGTEELCPSRIDLETAVPCHGMLFPLATFGRTSGALLVGGRPHQQSYDPDDQSLFAELSHELGIALLCLRDGVFAAAIRHGADVAR